MITALKQINRSVGKGGGVHQWPCVRPICLLHCVPSTCFQPGPHAEEMVRNIAGQKQGQVIQNHPKKSALYQEGYGQPPEVFKQRMTEPDLLLGVIPLATRWEMV